MVLVCILVIILIGINSLIFFAFMTNQDDDSSITITKVTKLFETKNSTTKSKDPVSTPKNENTDDNKDKDKPKEDTLYTCDFCSTKTQKVFFIDEYTVCVICDSHLYDFILECANCNTMKPVDDMYNHSICRKCYEHNTDIPSDKVYICGYCDQEVDSLINNFCPPCEEEYWNVFVVCSMCNDHVFRYEVTSSGVCTTCNAHLSTEDDSDENNEENNDNDNLDEEDNLEEENYNDNESNEDLQNDVSSESVYEEINE